jgi:hypothetical protein
LMIVVAAVAVKNGRGGSGGGSGSLTQQPSTGQSERPQRGCHAKDL